MESLLGGDPRDLLLETISGSRFGSWKAILEGSGLEEDAVREILDQLIKEDLVLEIGKKSKKVFTLTHVWNGVLTDLVKRIETYHQKNPLRVGMALEELKSQSGLEEIVFREAVNTLVENGSLSQAGPYIKEVDFEVQFTPEQNKLISYLLDQFQENPTLPPSVADCVASVGEDAYQALVATGVLKQVSADVVFTPGGYEKMVAELKKKITRDGPVTVAQVRDMFGSSRKYMLAFLERLDAEGVTVREGDLRRLK